KVPTPKPPPQSVREGAFVGDGSAMIIVKAPRRTRDAVVTRCDKGCLPWIRERCRRCRRRILVSVGIPSLNPSPLRRAGLGKTATRMLVGNIMVGDAFDAGGWK